MRTKVPNPVPDLAPLVDRVRGRLPDRIPNPTHLDPKALGIDTRSLAAFRILVGLLVVADVLLRSRNFGFYYTDDGIVSQELAETMTVDGAFSVYFFTGDPTVIAGLFVLTALVGVQLVVGYRTRLATLLAFLLVVSLDHHNPLVTSYADVLFRLLLLWAVFLPLGERWSVDAVHADREPRHLVVGLATTAALAQMIAMYVVNGAHKLQSQLWTGGDATPLVMGLDDMTFLLAPYARQLPTLLTIGGLMWLTMLLGSWMLVVLRGRARLALIGMFMGAHLSFAVTVRIGAFAYVAIAGLLLFLPPAFWDDAGRVVVAVRRWLAAVSGRFAPSVRLPPLRTRAASAAGRLPSPRVENRSLRLVGRAAAVCVLVVAVMTVLVVPLVGLTPVAADQGVPGGDRAANALSVNQPSWGVFAPHPRTSDRYYVFPAMTADNETLDAFNDRELTAERPYDELQHQYGTYRERFFMNSVRRGGPGDVVSAAYADHLCAAYAEEGVEIRYLNMHTVTEDITLDTIDDHEARDRDRTRFYRHACADEDAPIVIATGEYELEF